MFDFDGIREGGISRVVGGGSGCDRRGRWWEEGCLALGEGGNGVVKKVVVKCETLQLLGVHKRPDERDVGEEQRARERAARILEYPATRSSRSCRKRQHSMSMLLALPSRTVPLHQHVPPEVRALHLALELHKQHAKLGKLLVSLLHDNLAILVRDSVHAQYGVRCCGSAVEQEQKTHRCKAKMSFLDKAVMSREILMMRSRRSYCIQFSSAFWTRVCSLKDARALRASRARVGNHQTRRATTLHECA